MCIRDRVSDKLHSVFEEDRASFEGYWEDIAPFIKFGCIKDEKFYDRVKDIVLFKTLNHDYRTLEEYRKEKRGIRDRSLVTTRGIPVSWDKAISMGAICFCSRIP